MASTRKPAAARAARLPRSERALRLDRLLPSGRSLLVGFGLLALATSSYAVARGSSLFAVRNIEVEGARPRVVHRVEAALAPLAGESLLAIDRADVDRRLAALPDVQRLSFDRAFPHTLRVVVSAERPVAVLRRGSDAWLISERGRVLRPIPNVAHPLLPRVWVSRATSAAPREWSLLSDEEALVPAVALGRILTADRRFLRHVREAREREGELELVLRTGTELRLGTSDDLGLKVAVARRILEALGGAQVRYVDVSVPERAVARSQSQVAG